MPDTDTSAQVVILGSGPAGLTAALYAARANLGPIVIEGLDAGGQLMLTTEVENFPGFPDGIMGPELMAKIRAQAERFGAQFARGTVTKVDFSSQPLKVWTETDAYQGDAVIVATGAKARMLGLESEQQFLGRGVSTCATCDGFFYRGKELIVVGGGDSALEEAMFLTRFATKVTVVHRRHELRASKIMVERAEANPKLEFLWNTVIEEVLGEQTVHSVRIRDTINGSTTTMPVDGIFVAIGHSPNTDVLAGQLDLDENGYLLVPGPGTRTTAEGVFAAGDVSDHIYRQAITAAGMGCAAAIDTERWLEARHHAAAQ